MEDPNENVNLAEELAKSKLELETLAATLKETEKKKQQAESAIVNLRPAAPERELKDPLDYVKTLKNNAHLTNREYWQTSVDYRESVLRKYGKDVWSDTGRQTEQTQKVNTYVKQLLAECPNDEEFRLKMNMSLVDIRRMGR